MESIIKRAAMALGAGMSEAEVVESLKKSGHSDWDIFYAIEAAKVINKDRDGINNMMDTISKAQSTLLVSGFDPILSYGQTRSVFENDFERRYVFWLLERHQGNLSAAAREARMDRKHLYDLAKKHGLRTGKKVS